MRGRWPTLGRDTTAPPAIAPFDAGQAQAHQTAWAKHLAVPVEYENSIGMKFRLMPPGEFLMGSTPVEIVVLLNTSNGIPSRDRIMSGTPQHKVILTQPVYVGVTEVTQMQDEQVMGTNPSFFSSTGGGKERVANMDTDDHPVDSVNWNDATEFCAKRCQPENLKPFYSLSGETVTPLEGTGYRLPTDAECENACQMLAAGKRRVCCFDRAGISSGGVRAPQAADQHVLWTYVHLRRPGTPVANLPAFDFRFSVQYHLRFSVQYRRGSIKEKGFAHRVRHSP